MKSKKPLISVCVPTPDIYHHRNVKVIFQALISHFFTLRHKHKMLRKVPKIKDFYEFFLCSNTIVSTCTVIGNISTVARRSALYPFAVRYFKSLASVAESQLT